MNSDPYEEVKSEAGSVGFLPMTVQADVKVLTEHMMFLMLQIASRRKRQQGRERNFTLLFYFLSPPILPPPHPW